MLALNVIRPFPCARESRLERYLSLKASKPIEHMVVAVDTSDAVSGRGVDKTGVLEKGQDVFVRAFLVLSCDVGRNKRSAVPAIASN
jgi:hypothetical protein